MIRTSSDCFPETKSTSDFSLGQDINLFWLASTLLRICSTGMESLYQNKHQGIEMVQQQAAHFAVN